MRRSEPMVAAVNWDNVNLAGAFCIGAALGVIATIRITRVIADERRKRDRN